MGSHALVRRANLRQIHFCHVSTSLHLLPPPCLEFCCLYSRGNLPHSVCPKSNHQKQAEWRNLNRLKQKLECFLFSKQNIWIYSFWSFRISAQSDWSVTDTLRRHYRNRGIGRCLWLNSNHKTEFFTLSLFSSLVMRIAPHQQLPNGRKML